MADVTGIFGGGFKPPSSTPSIPLPPEHQFIDAVAAAGLEPPERVVMDGKIHRFRSGTKGAPGKGDKPGWYVLFADGVPAGRFGCWRAGVEHSWRADIGRPYSPAEEAAHAARMAEARVLRDAELERSRAVAADTVETIWSHARHADAGHPYLTRKGIQPHGARITGDGRLVLPLYSADGQLSTLQYIAHDGTKLYHPGGQTGGRFWMVGTLDESGTLYLAEGFATAASIHEATGRPCVVAYSASNLTPVLAALRNIHGASQDICIVADHDASGVGQKNAEQAAFAHGARVILPPIVGDANDYRQSGADLALLLNPPPTAEWLIPADDFASVPLPISWLVRNWVQERALVMVHGPSGGGKTFLVLDWMLRIAAGGGDWQGHRVKAGAVVYLAGEGHHGLRGRIAGWKQRHQVSHLDMWLSPEGLDLNTSEGLRRVQESIRALPSTPSCICVDTLHRFLRGDENSAQDARTMLDACARLMIEFGCTVILVHHTGVSDEAQHRARGSSAWRGALDIEISVVPGGPGKPIEVVQRKSKDAELAPPAWVELEQVQLSGWIDEDGQPVTTAVISEAAAPPSKDDAKLAGEIKRMTDAWWHSGALLDEIGRPYISRSGFADYLAAGEGLTENTIKNYLKGGAKGRLISTLIDAGMIEKHAEGWSVIDDTLSAVLCLRRQA